jgi:hypothetical protein
MLTGEIARDRRTNHHITAVKWLSVQTMPRKMKRRKHLEENKNSSAPLLTGRGTLPYYRGVHEREAANRRDC